MTDELVAKTLVSAIRYLARQYSAEQDYDTLQIEKLSMREVFDWIHSQLELKTWPDLLPDEFWATSAIESEASREMVYTCLAQSIQDPWNFMGCFQAVWAGVQAMCRPPFKGSIVRLEMAVNFWWDRGSVTPYRLGCDLPEGTKISDSDILTQLGQMQVHTLMHLNAVPMDKLQAMSQRVAPKIIGV